ncbi:MAG: o-succinylbenzoate synthase, partial [Bacillaceae bacterium]
MKITSVTIYHIQAPLKTPFRASYGVYEQRESFLLEVQEENGITGWGEVVAFSQPWYTEETIKTTYQMLKDYLIPMVLQNSYLHPREFINDCSWIKRNNMAKAGLEGALWDLYAKLQQKPLYQALGGQRKHVDVGVVIGLSEPKQMMKQIEQYIEEGYKRFKIKISPKMDYELIKEIRTSFPTLPLMVDANSAYQLGDIKKLKALDEFQLMMIEQPFGHF